MSKPKEKYWICIIGPVEESKLKMGANTPLKNAVENAYTHLFGEESINCWSGWGSDQEKANTVNAILAMGKDEPLYILIQSMLKNAGSL